VSDTGSPRAGRPALTIDLPAVAEAARVLTTLGADLAAARNDVEGQALDGLAALPQSDLFNAYAFCWGRWSRVLDDGVSALTALAGVARDTAVEVGATDGAAADAAYPL
jgi:hypothetical protein